MHMTSNTACNRYVNLLIPGAPVVAGCTAAGVGEGVPDRVPGAEGMREGKAEGRADTGGLAR